ncbi:hypothetical protein PCANC_21775 [Puccinia coronata f. sp. avenae]|uniref:PSP proline-rich domain-containing protein n=1 Tax=Puccinia coronata f. sp. avenae TaxID=200324 RepID=A0A2N5TUW5_9BASI|nr:hypothetical protein PCANC_21775 [Puccinia coronata f. sp. avenae]
MTEEEYQQYCNYYYYYYYYYPTSPLQHYQQPFSPQQLVLNYQQQQEQEQQEQEQQQQQPEAYEAFFYDQQPLFSQEPFSQLAQLTAVPDYHYSSQARHVVGTGEDDKILHPSDIRRCFNCGDPSHSLVGCPETRNEPLIRLSKQIFKAHHTQGTTNGWTEGAEDDELLDHHQDEGHPAATLKDLSCADSVQGTIEQRKWLASQFLPGQPSAALREALFWELHRGTPDDQYMDTDRPMPWFQTMEKWGYPPGYAVPLDAQYTPFQRIMQRIDNLDKDHTWDSVGILEMHRGHSPGAESDDSSDEEQRLEEEEEILRLLVPGYEALGKQSVPLPPEERPPISSSKSSLPEPSQLPPLPDSPPPSPPPPPPPPPRDLLPLQRLVKYEGGNFSSDLLPVYNGQMISTQLYLNYYSSHHTMSSKDPSNRRPKRKRTGWKKNHDYAPYQQQQQQNYQRHHQHGHSQGQERNVLQPSVSNSPGSSTSSTSLSSLAPFSASSANAQAPWTQQSEEFSKAGGAGPPWKGKERERRGKSPSKMIKQRWKEAALNFEAAKTLHQPPARSPGVDLPPPPPSLPALPVLPASKPPSASSSTSKRFYIDKDQPSSGSHHSLDHVDLLNYDDEPEAQPEPEPEPQSEPRRPERLTPHSHCHSHHHHHPYQPDDQLPRHAYDEPSRAPAPAAHPKLSRKRARSSNYPNLVKQSHYHARKAHNSHNSQHAPLPFPPRRAAKHFAKKKLAKPTSSTPC